MINANNIIDIRSAGYKALTDALGPVGFVRFMQQYDNGSGDYTRAKYEEPDDDMTWEQLVSEVRKYNDSEPVRQTV